jgi:hypothetical protein
MKREADHRRLPHLRSAALLHKFALPEATDQFQCPHVAVDRLRPKVRRGRSLEYQRYIRVRHRVRNQLAPGDTNLDRRGRWGCLERRIAAIPRQQAHRTVDLKALQGCRAVNRAAGHVPGDTGIRQLDVVGVSALSCLGWVDGSGRRLSIAGHCHRRGKVRPAGCSMQIKRPRPVHLPRAAFDRRGRIVVERPAEVDVQGTLGEGGCARQQCKGRQHANGKAQSFAIHNHFSKVGNARSQNPRQNLPPQWAIAAPGVNQQHAESPLAF